jgi:hypothetical protein
VRCAAWCVTRRGCSAQHARAGPQPLQ